jgi:ABC-type antimicrobial peptide transport system permease subunit
MKPLLFGVTPYDPTVLVGGSAAVSVLAVFAAAFPARRAAATDPIQSLRTE